MDVTIKNVPEGCENYVRETALRTIENFLRGRDMKVAKEVVDKFKADVAEIRAANSEVKPLGV